MKFADVRTSMTVSGLSDSNVALFMVRSPADHELTNLLPVMLISENVNPVESIAMIAVSASPLIPVTSPVTPE